MAQESSNMYLGYLRDHKASLKRSLSPSSSVVSAKRAHLDNAQIDDRDGVYNSLSLEAQHCSDHGAVLTTCRRFDSQVFSLDKEPQRRLFIAHESILSKISTLKSLCLSEKGSSTITLPEDDPEAFGSILKFLYAGTFKLARC